MKKYIPTLADCIEEGLIFSEGYALLESICSCAIEDITIDKAGFKRLCKRIVEERKHV